MRCPDCNKFVSYAGEEEPEEQYSEVNDSGDISVEARATKQCAECGSDLCGADVIIETTDDDVAKHMTDHEGETDEEGELKHVLEIDVELSSSPGKKGAQNVVAHYKVTCSCKEEFEGDIEEEVPAGEFEEN